MSNQIYGYNPSSYGGSSLSSLFTSRSATDPYSLSDPSQRYVPTSVPFSSSDSIDPFDRGGSIYQTDSSARYGTTATDMAFPGSRMSGGLGAAAAPSSTSKPLTSWSGIDVGSSYQAVLASLKRQNEALYHQSIMGNHNSIGQSEALFSTNTLAKRPRLENATNLPVYPQRPGEKDCAHYMLTRTCKFGESCKFDHPIWVPEGGIPDWKEVPLVPSSEALPERPGVPDCPYFLKTQKCKFGFKCKFNHPKDTVVSQSSVETVDVSLLPERPSEPPCTFYIKTGRCKFGAACKFHHPKDIEVPQANEENDNGFQTESAVKNGGIVIGDATPKPFTPFTPASLHNSKGLPVRPGEVDCPFYLKTGSCKYGATCRYNHPDRNVINPSVAAGLSNAFISSPAANLNFGVINPAASILPAIDPRLAQTTSIPKPVHPLDDLLKNLLEKGLITAPSHVNADDITELSLKGRAIKAVEVDLDRPQTISTSVNEPCINLEDLPRKLEDLGLISAGNQVNAEEVTGTSLKEGLVKDGEEADMHPQKFKRIKATSMQQLREDIFPDINKEKKSEVAYSSVLKARLKRGDMFTRKMGPHFLEFHYTDEKRCSSFPLEDDVFEKVVGFLDFDSVMSLSQVSPIYLDIWRKIKSVKLLEEPHSRSPEQIVNLFRIFVAEEMKLDSVVVHKTTSYFNGLEAEELLYLVKELGPKKVELKICFPPILLPHFGRGVRVLKLINCGRKLNLPRFIPSGLESLTELCLERVQLEPNGPTNEIVLQVPTVKNLNLKSCIHNAPTLNRFQICSENLSVLSIHNEFWCRTDNLTLEVSAENLTEVSLVGYVYKVYVFSAPLSNAIARARIELKGDVRSLELFTILKAVEGCSELKLSNHTGFDPKLKGPEPSFTRLRFVLVEGFTEETNKLLLGMFRASRAEVVLQKSMQAPKAVEGGFLLPPRQKGH